MQTPVKILLIEDNPADARLVREWLQQTATASFELEHTERLSAGIKRLEEKSFDAVLLDLGLPDSQGLETLQRIHAGAPLVPILVLTGLADEQAGLQAVKEGAQDYLLKGQVNESLLVRSIGFALERKRGEEALRRKNEELATAEEELRAQLDEILTSREALRKSEERYRSTLDGLLEGCQLIGYDWRYLYANEVACRQGRKAKGDLLGRTMMECYPGIEKTEAFVVFKECLETRTPRRMENEFAFPDGTKGWFELNIEPVPEGLFILSEDITERRSLEEQVLQSQKMEAIGSLAGGVAHDFNNILMAIMSYSELLQLKLDDGPLREYAEGIQQSVEKAASLTQRLLTFSRKEVSNPYVLALNEVVADAEKMFRRLIGEDIELVIHPAPDAGRVKADPVQLEQVIMNLAVNARDAMPQGGRLFIQTANAVLEESDVRVHPNAAPGPYVQLSVSDTGCGMDAATQARIFEPFFTTKEKGKGTGLGLSTVYGIIHQSGGFIDLESAPGKGARFKVYLPRVEEEAGETQKSAVNSELPKGSETVLLVEDEPEILGLVNEILSGQGYTVLQAGTGNTALRLAERHSGPIHLLFTDVVMPGMSGRVLAERLASLRPEVRVIYTSGYTDDAILRHGLRTEGLNFLQKPFRPEALLHKVREVLNAPEGPGV